MRKKSMDFEQILNERTQWAETALAGCFPVGGDCPASLSEAMAYSVLAGGKRLRPVLLLSACVDLGGEAEAARPFACALEMIHTYSLIHDDLPAMDNDDLRRGRPTNHKMFGEALAILAGDGLLSLAFSTMAAACTGPREVRALQEIATGAGVQGMVAGQVEDVLHDGQPVGRELLAFIHAHKTASMLQGALCAGGALAGAGEETREALRQAGLKLGLAFQIQDDILDVTGDEAALGKPLHSDEKNHKTTYADFYGLEGADALSRQYSDEAAQIFDGLGLSFLAGLTKKLTQRKA